MYRKRGLGQAEDVGQQVATVLTERQGRILLWLGLLVGTAWLVNQAGGRG